MPDTIEVLSPLAHVAVREATAAPRPSSLDGLRPGILENRKANARLLMETMVERLGERHDLGDLVVGSKPVGGPPSDSTIDALRNGADFLLIGSCD
ncbi:MAG: hypothetical protein OXH40_09970 [Chloroflexi bacterium]|nr:hypothetical protein [Chloroflexota bacterium]MDE2708178.1 hypothetical protein [Chloroflexota bacterium]